MIETDLAWAAGFFDGEGSINIFKRRPNSLHASIQVSQCGNSEPIYKFKSLLGGHVSITTEKSGRKKYTWAAASNIGIAALKLLLPYLINKKAEAQLLIDFSLLRRRNRQGSFENFNGYEIAERLSYREALMEYHQNGYEGWR